MAKHILCFFKCRRFGISLNPNKCAIYGIFRDNTGTYSSQRGKSLDPKKIQAIVQMLVPSNPQQIQVFNKMTQFYKCFIKNFAFVMASITKLMRKIKQFM
jgi:hypothetical protein